MNRFASHTTEASSARRGSVLILVMVVVVMLTFATYVFTESMLVERRVSRAYEQEVRSRSCVDSGIELAAAYLGEPREPGDEGFFHRPELFQGTLVYDETSTWSAGRFAIVSAVPGEEEVVRFGLADESARLNLNTLVTSTAEEELLLVATENGGVLELPLVGELDVVEDVELARFQRERLLVVPGMTEELADCLLDWLDEDDERREFGAEGPDYYESLATPYTPTNGPMESLEELLLVKGVTRALLDGEDANRNGRLDPNENDGDASAPFDDADGQLDAGWRAYFTVHSRETNLRTDGSERIDLNQPLLTELYDALEPQFGEDVARFVTAYRINGPVDQTASTQNPFGQVAGRGEEAAQELAVGIAKAVASGQGAVTRGGLDLSRGGIFKINSLYDLVESEVDVEVDGTATTLTSPWNGSDLIAVMPELVDTLSTTDADSLDGRVNVNEARYEALLTVPGMTQDLADAIAKSTPVGPDGQPLADAMQSRTTTAWLVAEGLVDVVEMRRLDRFLTARGDVYRAQVVGYFDHGGAFTRVEALLDASSPPVRVLGVTDLTTLGIGYPRSRLSGIEPGVVGSTGVGQ